MFPSVLGISGASLRLLEAPSNRDASARRHDRPIRVLILIPTLHVGGAEMDLVRTIPRIDRRRFQVTVCTFLQRGELGKVLQDHGIEVVGPFAPSLYNFRQALRRIARKMRSWFNGLSPAPKLRPLHRLVRSIVQPISSWFKRTPAAVPFRIGLCALENGLRILRRAITICFRTLRALYLTPRSIAYLLDVLRLARPIARYVRASEIDVIHTILPNSYLVGACASALAGRRRPILMSRLSLNLYQQDDRMVGFVERHILHRTVDAAIGNSNAILRDLKAEGINQSKLHLVYNGIDALAFSNEMVDRSTARRRLNISNSALVFSIVANLHPYKGHDDLLLALAALSETLQSEWKCLVVGKDVYDRLSELKRLCRRHGLSENVEFLGSRKDIPMILSASDIHISASHQEGLPNNIIEAMCAHLPVVATAVGGVSELVVDGKTGYLLPPQDAGRMTDALVALAQAPNRRKAFGEAGYSRAVSHFGIDNNVAAFESIYAGLAGARRMPAA